MPFNLTTEFPWTASGEVVYCNAASTGPIPARTVEVLDEWTRLRREPWRISLEQQFGALATARRLCAGLIGADAEEIALVPNTSTGLNIAAQVLPVAKGKVILGHDGEFPSNVYPWMAIARRGGARYEQIPLDAAGLPDWEALRARLDRGDVGLVAISWVSFVSGDRADLASIGALCRERDIWFVVDAIQGVGTTRLDVHACNVDILACGAQKWLLSPWGSGFCYIRKELIERFEPATVGWLAQWHAQDFSRMLQYDLTYFDDARRFEVATIPYQDMAGMNASLSLIGELGLERIEAHVHGLASRLVEGITRISGLTLLTPRDPSRRAGIVSFTVPNGPEMSKRLDAHGIVHSIRGGGVLRLSPHLYNTEREMDRVLECLDG